MDLILGPVMATLAPWLAGAVALLLAWLGVRRSVGAQKDAKAVTEALRASVSGSERSRQGAAEGQAKLRAGKTPAEIVRENDGAWK